jgi:hypothetical protein
MRAEPMGLILDTAIWHDSCKTKGHEENLTCSNPIDRRFKFRAVIDRRENWATAAASRYSRPTTSPGAGLLLGGWLLVPSREPLQVA